MNYELFRLYLVHAIVGHFCWGNIAKLAIKAEASFWNVDWAQHKERGGSLPHFCFLSKFSIRANAKQNFIFLAVFFPVQVPDLLLKMSYPFAAACRKIQFVRIVEVVQNILKVFEEAIVGFFWEIS